MYMPVLVHAERKLAHAVKKRAPFMASAHDLHAFRDVTICTFGADSGHELKHSGYSSDVFLPSLE